MHSGERLQVPGDDPLQPSDKPSREGVWPNRVYVAGGVRAGGEELIEQIREGIGSATEEHVTNYTRAHPAVVELIQRGFLLGSDHAFCSTDGQSGKQVVRTI